MTAKRILVLLVAILILVLIAPRFVTWAKSAILTQLYGDELAAAILAFENTTLSSSSKELYYTVERESFRRVATGAALKSRLRYWDDVYAEENPRRIYRDSNFQITNVSVTEYTDHQAKAMASIGWQQTVIDPSTSLVLEMSNRGCRTNFGLIKENGVWKVSDFETPSPKKY